LFNLNNYQLLPIFLFSIVVILAASEIGHWFGGRAGNRSEASILTVEGAVLGLLALMIGFTFAMALKGRHPGRSFLGLDPTLS
jgi:CDP-diglyceride synthetase